jgi:hypothetical protein
MRRSFDELVDTHGVEQFCNGEHYWQALERSCGGRPLRIKL